MGGWKSNIIRPSTPIARPRSVPKPLLKVPDTLGEKRTQFKATGGVVESGQVYPNPRGQIVVIEVDPMRVVYLHLGKYYYQEPNHFLADNWINAYITGVLGAKGMATFVQYEIEFLVGVMSGATRAGALAAKILMVAQTTKFVAENYKLVVMIPAFWEARKILKRHAPTLYANVFKMFLGKMLEKAPEVMVKSLAKAAFAKMAGRVLGSLGGSQFNTLKKKILEVTKLVGTFLVKESASLAAMEYVQIATNFIEAIKHINAAIKQGDAELIAQEMIDHRKHIDAAINLILDAVKKEQQGRLGQRRSQPQFRPQSGNRPARPITGGGERSRNGQLL